MMSVGLLLLTHETMGGALVNAARHVLGRLPLTLDVMEIPASCCDPENTARDASRRAKALDQGDGVLVLTDLYGATPCNVAHQLPQLGVHMHSVSGLNLPMLLRAVCYRNETLDALVVRALAGASQGVMQVAVTAPQNQTPLKNDQDPNDHQQ